MGDDVQLISPRETLSPVGPVFRRRNFRVVGIFSLGLYQFDSESAFIHLDVAKRVFGEDSQVFIELRVDDMFKSREVVEAIHARFGPEYRPQEWSDMNKSLFSALWLEKMAISITIGLIVMVAALNIVASLILLVMEKSRDIAILKTMGSPASSIRRIFMLQGLIIGLVGTDGRRRLRLGADLHSRPLSIDQGAGRRLPDLVHPVQTAAVRFRGGGGVGDRDLFRRDHLSVTAGGQARSGSGSSISMTTCQLPTSNSQGEPFERTG